MDNGKQPIAPTMYTKCGDGNYQPLIDVQKSEQVVKFVGLTKREYFALHLLQGIVSGADRHSQIGDCQNWNYEHLSKISIKAADALLSELSNGDGR